MAGIVPNHLRKKTTNRTCICGCGAPVYGRWPYLKGHNKPAKRGRPRKVEAAIEPAVKSNGHAKPVSLGNGEVEIKLHVRLEWLDLAWATLDLEQKAAAIAAVLEAF